MNKSVEEAKEIISENLDDGESSCLSFIDNKQDEMHEKEKNKTRYQYL